MGGLTIPFGPAVRDWFAREVGEPTEVQRRGWEAIGRGLHSLLLAPTGSGKTLAAFLSGIDTLTTLDPDAPDGVRLLYVSPLKALVYDIDRNLRRPLNGIAGEGRDIRVDVRTGDTPQRDRRQQLRHPADILVTTPESLFLMLTSRARETLRTVQAVIVDEIHVMAASKRGTHLALSLERLSEIAEQDPQRIGLSATVRPADAVASFLGGDRAVEIIDTSAPPNLDLEVVVPVRDMTAVDVSVPARALAPSSSPGRHESQEIIPDGEKGIWAAIYPQLIDLIDSHTTTLIFVNTRGLCERLTRRLNEVSGRALVQAHHGSVSHERRAQLESDLKAGRLPALVATSSLELGIDMGTIDLVVTVESPGSVSRGLQRVGRAGHQVGATSAGRIYPKYRGDLLEAATVARGMVRGELEPLHIPSNVLDVLAQQVVAMCADSERTVDSIFEIVTRAAPYRALPRSGFEAVLEMLAGRYPSNELADLRPRISWDRERNVLSPRKGSRMSVLLNAGTIPDRGLFRVQLGPGGPKLGELDEEMVYESKAGDVFALGASTWRVDEITHDRVIVSPAPGQMGRLPFWRGDGIGRPVELGEKQGELLREIGSRPEGDAVEWLQRETPLDRYASENLARFVHEQREVSAVPTDLTLVAERFRDELGDWRMCLLSPYGSRVHGPLAIAARALLSASTGVEAEVSHNDDGLIWRSADLDDLPDIHSLLPASDDLERIVAEHIGASALFAAMFRENAGRSLLLTRRRVDGRNPLWSQRLKAKNLLGVVKRYPRFPIVLETYRQCMQDIFDLPGAVRLLERIERGEIRIEVRETPSPSPFATDVVFEHVAQYLYEVDAPAAETRARALSLDRSLLRRLLGHASERELVDEEVVHEVEARLQRLHPDHLARDADELNDVLRELGALDDAALAARAAGDSDRWLAQLRRQGRVVFVGHGEWAAIENAELYAAALDREVEAGALGLSDAERDDPVGALVALLAARRGPFSATDLAALLGASSALLLPVLQSLVARGVLITGELRPGGTDVEWCDANVWRRIKRTSLARLRDEIEPVDAATYARFLRRHQKVDGPARGEEGVERALEQLEGLVLPWSVWATSVLPRRVQDFRIDMLDTLCGSGAWVWRGFGKVGARDGRIAFFRRDHEALLWRRFSPAEPSTVAAQVFEAIPERGAVFASDLGDVCANRDLQRALLELAWAGWIRNDRVAPLLRARTRPGRGVRAVDGRWSRVPLTVEPSTQGALAWCETVLHRYGVVGRDTAAAEALDGGFGAIYDVLKELENQGRSRRGLFVSQMTGIQFSQVGAVDALRGHDDGPAVWSLAAMDPAQPFGAHVPWPETQGTPRRVAGAHVVLVSGGPAIYLSASRRELLLLTDIRETLVAALRHLASTRLDGGRTLAIDKVDGAVARGSKHRDVFYESGFVEDHRGFIAL